MRILFTFVGGNGHFQPLVPIAQAAQQAGHTIAFASSHSMLAAVENMRLTCFAIGKSGSNDPPQRMPLLALDMQREEYDLREKFARQAARSRAKAILDLCAQWQPDLIVCDEVDFGSMVAAEHLGIPHASVLVIAAGGFIRADVVAEPLNEIRAEHDLPPDPDLAMLSRYLVLSPIPPGYRDPAFPLPPTAHFIRPVMVNPGNDSAAPPFVTRSDRPLVYFTLGTIFNMESGDLFSRVLAGIRDLPFNFVVTAGHEIDPAEFGPQPANIHIAQYIPQALILPHCQAVISHGGSGSVLGALAHSLPMVLIPMGADQPLNAARCDSLGVAQVLDPVQAAPESIRAAVSAVLENAAYRQAAGRMKDEIAAMPEPASIIPLLERLAADRQPLITG